MKRTKEYREFVAFITVQTGDDLIVSFAVCEPDDPADIESLFILRTPKYESFLEEWERGASVSFDRERKGDDEVVLLREVFYAPDGKCIKLRTDHQTYQARCSKSRSERTLRHVWRVSKDELRFQHPIDGRVKEPVGKASRITLFEEIKGHIRFQFTCTPASAPLKVYRVST